jgi:hypothetical protein
MTCDGPPARTRRRHDRIGPRGRPTSAARKQQRADGPPQSPHRDRPHSTTVPEQSRVGAGGHERGLGPRSGYVRDEVQAALTLNRQAVHCVESRRTRPAFSADSQKSVSVASMALELGRLDIEQIVFHELPEDKDPVLSEAVEDSGDEPRIFFRDRMVASLASAGRRIQFQPKPTSKVPALVRTFLEASGDLLKISQECAIELAKYQVSKNISPGLLCVADVRHKKASAMGLVKLEMQRGIQLSRHKVKGKRSFTIKSVNDLMMNETTRVFKAVVFYNDGDTIRGLVSDHQVPRSSIRGAAHGAADFFLERFLGGVLEELPEVTTARFYEVASKFIRSFDDKDKQYRYDTALHAELMSNAADINPTGFARRHIDLEDRPKFTAAIKDADVPIAAFGKDTSRIDSHIAQRKLQWRSGLSLAGPSRSFDEHVTMGEGGASVTITDEIKRVGRP